MRDVLIHTRRTVVVMVCVCVFLRISVRVFVFKYECARVCICVCLRRCEYLSTCGCHKYLCVRVRPYDQMHAHVCQRVGVRMNLNAGERVK